MTAQLCAGLDPVYDEKSELLILGSFPSVKSRAIGFYYGNPQNRFWRTVCGFFGEDVPADPAGKTEFLLRRKIALWDVVVECEIVGSKDDSIAREKIADLPMLMKNGKISHIFLNGNKAYSLFAERFPQYLPVAQKLPSTSPANPRFSREAWWGALASVFPSV